MAMEEQWQIVASRGYWGVEREGFFSGGSKKRDHWGEVACQREVARSLGTVWAIPPLVPKAPRRAAKRDAPKTDLGS